MRHLRLDGTILIATILTICVLALGGLAWADEGAEPEDRWGDCDAPRTVIKKLRYMNPEVVPSVLSAINKLSVRVAPESRAVVITACPGRIDLAIEILHNLDEPPAPASMVEVVMYILAARDEAGKGDTPANLQPVVEQLEGLFDYRHFALLDTLFLRTVDQGSAAVSGSLEGAVDLPGNAAEYRLGFNRAEVFERDTGHSVRLTGLEFVAGGSAAIRTDVEVKEGQKAVVGKARPNKRDEAWILVLEVKVLS